LTGAEAAGFGEAFELTGAFAAGEVFSSVLGSVLGSGFAADGLESAPAAGFNGSLGSLDGVDADATTRACVDVFVDFFVDLVLPVSGTLRS